MSAGENTRSGTAKYERALAIVKLICEYSLTKIKEDLDNKSDIFNTYFLN